MRKCGGGFFGGFKTEIKILRFEKNRVLFLAVIFAAAILVSLFLSGNSTGIYNNSAVRLPSVFPSRFTLRAVLITVGALGGVVFSYITSSCSKIHRPSLRMILLYLFLELIFLVLWYPLLFSASAGILAFLSLASSILFSLAILHEARASSPLVGVYVFTVILITLWLAVASLSFTVVN